MSFVLLMAAVLTQPPGVDQRMIDQAAAAGRVVAAPEEPGTSEAEAENAAGAAWRPLRGGRRNRFRQRIQSRRGRRRRC